MTTSARLNRSKQGGSHNFGKRNNNLNKHTIEAWQVDENCLYALGGRRSKRWPVGGVAIRDEAEGSLAIAEEAKKSLLARSEMSGDVFAF